MLKGLRVLDVGSFVAGPAAATVMGDFGADVIKIEPLEGDAYRNLLGHLPVDFFWLMDARNKRSLALDLRSSSGRAVLDDLLPAADVFVTNYRASLQTRLRLEHARLTAEYPRLIYAQINGFGIEGDEAERTAFDTTGWWARSGMMDFVRARGETPRMSAPGMGDHPTAMALFGAVMAALYRRERTGRGGHVSTSLVANGAWSHSMTLQAMIGGADWHYAKQTREGPGNPLNQIYATKDGRFVLLSILNVDKEWPGFTRALGCEHWQEDPRFVTDQARHEHAADLAGEVRQAMAALALAELRARFEAEDITYGHAALGSEVIEDPQLRANDIIKGTGESSDDYPLTIDSPIRLDGEEKVVRRAAKIGEHSREILAELGYASERIDALIDAGVVGSPE